MSGRANVRQYLAGRYAAQEAKRAGQARADDHAYATTPAQRAYTLTLPLPPSVNVLYGQSATGQKFLQPKQRDFRHDVAMIVAAARKGDPPLTGRIEMQVTLYDNGKRAWDIDNRLKALLDAMAHGGAYLNDNQLDILHVQRIVRADEREECVVVLQELAA
jgi:crossover junction endodeoxyribonuclease RusA